MRVVLLASFGVLLLAQEGREVPPEEAATHLLKKVDPVYPSFALAAGIEGVERIHIGIWPDGYIHEVSGMPDGPDALFQAAQDAVVQYVYRPFTYQGQPVCVKTTVDVVFKLPAGKKPQSYTAPRIRLKDFRLFDNAKGAAARSPLLRNWLAEDQQHHYEGSPFSLPDCTETLSDLEAATEIIEIPVGDPSKHIYLVRYEVACMCGATGNCIINLLDEDASGIRAVARESGWGYYLHRREGEAYPDVFFSMHMSARETMVEGFSNASGYWGKTYCGSFIVDDHRETGDIHECR
jgi:hypothetical protein